MTRLLFLILFFLVNGLAAQLPGQDGTVETAYEHITSFHSDILLSRDGTVTVTENIKVYAAGEKIRRGIFRSLPRWRNINHKKTRISYEIVSVKRDGAPEQYHTEKSGSDLLIYFGRKDFILSPGFYEYELKYETTDQIGFFPGYDEFYWNVNGTLWDFATDSVSARVTFPEEAEIVQNACYTGLYGNNSTNCEVAQISTNVIEWSAGNLQPNEGLTVAAGIKKGVFPEPPPPGFFKKYGPLLGLLLVALFLGAYFIFSWQKYGVDPAKPVIYPQFSPPQNLTPASLGYLEKSHYSPDLITAAIVNLAVKGYLKISEGDKMFLGIFGQKKYTLQRLKEEDDQLGIEEKRLLKRLLPQVGNSLSFDGKYNPKIESAVNDFKANLKFQHDKFLNDGNNSRLLVLPLLLILACYGAGLYFSFQLTFEKVYLGAGIAYGIILFVLGVFISAYFERSLFAKILFGLMAIGFPVLLALIFVNDSGSTENINFYASYFFITLGVSGLVLYQYLIKKPSPEKLETQSLIEGFRMYLGTAEEKTLQFHNPPKLTPEIFEQLLPYALVLGVEKIWGEKFENLLKNSAMGSEGYQTSWFAGRSMMHMNFASSLNASMSSSIASSSTQPSSSGSGSGGGGFAGGGGGGGGGGGW